MCDQQDDKIHDCMRRNILLENICKVCQVVVGEKDKQFLQDGKAIYVGEISCSIYERLKQVY